MLARPESSSPIAPAAHRADLSADVIVIGGGPGGSTAATLLSQRGRRVLLIEKDRHPRFHIGESLLPFNLPLFDQLGCSRVIAGVGLIKRANIFTRWKIEKARSFLFPKRGTEHLRMPTITRSVFDHALLQPRVKAAWK